MTARWASLAIVTALASTVASPGAVVAQSAAPPAAGTATMSTESFLARARAGTSRYRSQSAAVTDGYKRVGVEFPAMGEHWVHLGRVLEDSLIPERPSVLIYVNVDGEPRLAGVAYTDLLQGGEASPSFPAPGGWHEHNGTVADESFPLAHEAMHATTTTSAAAEPEMRLAVLHAWLWSANPAGVFVTDNWSLPFLRLGISPPPSAVPRDALHALGLAADEEGYLLLTLRTGLGLTMPEEAAASRVLSAHREQALGEAARVRAARRLTSETSDRLVAAWSDTWSALERALPRRATALRTLRRQLG